MPLSVASTSKRIRLRVRGIVQGVGFRPFVFKLAGQYGLGGFVRNDGEGVVIELEGAEHALESFCAALEHSPPPLARIDDVQRETAPALGETAFEIRRSERGGAVTMVSPDIALCDACFAELHDPADRRHRYPFINCTDCGPRYTIITALPYDRPNTSMRAFAMCPACEAEYNDPANRRYHAQPISCFDCGPRLALLDPQGREIGTQEQALDIVARMITEGKIVALKGMGGFHLVCDATNEEAVRTLRERKQRPSKPLAVMFPSPEMIRAAAKPSAAEERLILSKERPIVVIKKLAASTLLADSIAPGINRVGVFLPYTPLHMLLLESLDRPVVATSANLSDAPIITDAPTLLNRLGQVVDAVLDYDRDIVNACDDSVVMDAGNQRVLLRMARGFAPRSFPLPFETDMKILAVGAHQKSTMALGFGRHMILSPHIGDLGSIDAFEYFERTLDTFKHFYGFEPDMIVCDKHPGYDTVKWAQRQALPVLQVQHHHAHALACMAEYGLNKPVLAFCFDGTGFGEDEVTLWGGEVLRAGLHGYEHVARLRSFRLIGGERAVREPRRVALSLLFECYSLDEVLALQNPAVESFGATEIKSLHTMWQRGLNAPACSSVGRLFDAAASLAGLAQRLSYEGESGLQLESAAAGTETKTGYEFGIRDGVIDWEPMLKAMLSAPSPGDLAAKLHVTLAQIIVDIARRHTDTPVVLTGGVFQNRLLVERVTKMLEDEGLRYYLQRDTPVNDGGIALGQLYYALHKGET